MKRNVIWLIAILALVVTGATVAWTEAQSPHRWCHQQWHHAGPLGYVVHELNLSDAQQAQIKSLWQTERPAIAALVHQVADEAGEMNAATSQGNLDENKVQEIAARTGDTIAKLIVEKERLTSQIYTSVLNPEQRTKADELREKFRSRLDHIADWLGK